MTGSWLDLKLFGRLDEAAFRKVVLVLLLASAALLIVQPAAGIAALQR